MSDQLEPRRFYGTDTTEELATLVEATVDEDGTVVIGSVVLDLSDVPADLLHLELARRKQSAETEDDQ